MWFRVCNICHANLVSCPNAALAAWELSLKLKHDRENFDLERFLSVGRKHDKFVTMDDIDNAMAPEWARGFCDG